MLMSEIDAIYGGGFSLESFQNSQNCKAKESRLSSLIESFEKLGSNANQLSKDNLFGDIKDLSKNLHKLQGSNTSFETFTQVSQKALDFFTKHEHESLFEQFESLNEFSKKRKKRPNIQEYISASLQHSGIWQLNTAKGSDNPTNKIQAPQGTKQAHQANSDSRKFNGLIKQLDDDERLDHYDPCLQFVPTSFLPNLPHNNLSEIIAFAIAQDITFESFHSIQKSGQLISNPDLDAKGIAVTSMDMSVEEIYEMIQAILNKVILTEEDIFILMQLIGEGGIQLIGFMPNNILEEIASVVDESIQSIANNLTSVEDILALLAHIQEFSQSGVCTQLDVFNLDIDTDSIDNISVESRHLQINQLHTSTDSTSSTSLDIAIDPVETAEQVSGAQSYQLPLDPNTSQRDAKDDVYISDTKVTALQRMGESLLNLSNQSKEQFCSGVLQVLIDVMTAKLDEILGESLDILDGLTTESNDISDVNSSINNFTDNDSGLI